MNQEACEKLRKRLNEIPFEDDDDLLFYIQYSSRLALLGDRSYFDRLNLIVKEPLYAGRIDEIMINRCREGLWDIDEQMGEDLGFALIEAQDFWCFYQLEEVFSSQDRLYSPKVSRLLKKWADQTSFVPIHQETEDVIEAFRETYPLPEENLLPVVAAPVTEIQYQMLESLYFPIDPKIYNAYWEQAEHPIVRHSDLYQRKMPKDFVLIACDDQTPPEAWIRYFDGLVCKAQMGEGVITVYCRLKRNWKFLIETDRADFVKRICIDSLPAIQDEARPKRWIFDLHAFSDKLRRKLVWGEMTIYTQDGSRIKINF